MDVWRESFLCFLKALKANVCLLQWDGVTGSLIWECGGSLRVLPAMTPSHRWEKQRGHAAVLPTSIYCPFQWIYSETMGMITEWVPKPASPIVRYAWASVTFPSTPLLGNSHSKVLAFLFSPNTGSGLKVSHKIVTSYWHSSAEPPHDSLTILIHISE